MAACLVAKTPSCTKQPVQPVRETPANAWNPLCDQEQSSSHIMRVPAVGVHARLSLPALYLASAGPRPRPGSCSPCSQQSCSWPPARVSKATASAHTSTENSEHNVCFISSNFAGGGWSLSRLNHGLLCRGSHNLFQPDTFTPPQGSATELPLHRLRTGSVTHPASIRKQCAHPGGALDVRKYWRRTTGRTVETQVLLSPCLGGSGSCNKG